MHVDAVHFLLAVEHRSMPNKRMKFAPFGRPTRNKVLGTLKESGLGGVGIGLGDVLPSIIAGVVCAACLAYVVGRIGNAKRS
jgi:hypothetical protein